MFGESCVCIRVFRFKLYGVREGGDAFFAFFAFLSLLSGVSLLGFRDVLRISGFLLG